MKVPLLPVALLATSILVGFTTAQQFGNNFNNFIKNNRLARQSPSADQMVQNILRWLEGEYTKQSRRSRFAQGEDRYWPLYPPLDSISPRFGDDAFRQGTIKEYLPPYNTDKPQGFTSAPPGSGGVDEEGNFVDSGYPPRGTSPEPPFTLPPAGAPSEKPGFPTAPPPGFTPGVTGPEQPGTTQPGYTPGVPGATEEPQKPGFPTAPPPGFTPTVPGPTEQPEKPGFPTQPQVPGTTAPETTPGQPEGPTVTSTGYTYKTPEPTPSVPGITPGPEPGATTGPEGPEPTAPGVTPGPEGPEGTTARPGVTEKEPSSTVPGEPTSQTPEEPKATPEGPETPEGPTEGPSEPEETEATEGPETPETSPEGPTGVSTEGPGEPVETEAPGKEPTEGPEEPKKEPEATEGPGTPETPTSPEGPTEGPSEPGKEATEGPKEPGVTEGPEGPTEGPEGPEKPGVTEGPEGPTEGPEGPPATEGPKEPGVTEGPEGPSATEGPKEPGVTEGPEGPTEGPEGPPATEGPQEPGVTEGPEGPTEGPEGPPATEGPEKPEVTEGPEGPPATESPKEPGVTEGPGGPTEGPEGTLATEGPKEPGVTEGTEGPEGPTEGSGEPPEGTKQPEGPEGSTEEPTSPKIPEVPTDGGKVPGTSPKAPVEPTEGPGVTEKETEGSTEPGKEPEGPTEGPPVPTEEPGKETKITEAPSSVIPSAQTPVGATPEQPGTEAATTMKPGEAPGTPGPKELTTMPGGEPSGTTKAPVTPDEDRHPPHIHAIDVECGKEMMTINIEFNRPFNGVIYSKGYYNMPECRYVQENSNQIKFSFTVNLNMCGTEFVNAFDTEGQSYLENVLVIQNEVGVQEVWDTVRSVRCLWEGNLKEQLSVSLMVGMLSQEIVTFSGDTAMAKLDVLQGRGAFGQPANGLVKIGDPLTLVVSVSGDPGFDVQVKDCRATDSSGSNTIPLTDDDGCILKAKLFGAFQKTRNTENTGASVIAYAYFNAFKFPDVMDLMIECNIELCKTDCEMCPKTDQALEPAKRRRRREANNATMLHDGVAMGKHLRVILPEDLASATAALGNEATSVCMSTQSFVFGSSLLVSLLTASCVLTAYMWLRRSRFETSKLATY
nr:unnamed protein product [Callosobruchus chinensis]